jgi:septal ring factor EnvC (AmiA/AmiB activator)
VHSIRFSVAACLLAVVVPLSAEQPDRTRTEALAQRASERLKVLYAEAERLAAEGRSLIAELRRLDVERQIRSEELRKIEADVESAATELAGIDNQMRRLEEQDQAAQPELRARIVELYKLGRGRYMRLLLSTPDLLRVGQASRMIAALAKRDRDRLLDYQRRLEELRATRQLLQTRAAQLAKLRTEAEQAQMAAVRAVQARNRLIEDIDKRRDLTAQLAGELQAAQQKLQVTLRSLAAGTATVEPASLPLRPFRGDLDWPVEGTVRRRFGAAGARGAASNGIEIAAAEDTPVRAVHGGTVAYAGSFEGFGNLVIVDHGGQAFTLYGNLLEVGSSRGTRVERGETVGTVGLSAGGAAGLYFELRVDGDPVDPLQWLKRP